jgi:capsular polysaccharide biosynthesis protein
VYRPNRRNEDRRYTAPGAPGPLVQESGGGEYILSLGDLLRVIWRRAWLILLLAMLFAGSAIGYDIFAKTPQYQASIKVFISQEEGTPSSLGTEAKGLQDVTVTMTTLLETRSVAEGVIERLGLSMTPGDLLGNISVEQEVPETQVIDATYTGTDPQEIQRIANALGEEFSERVAETNTAGSSLTATVWDRAALPQEPVSPKPLRDAALAFVLGAMLGIALAFVLEQLDDSWRSPEELEQVSGVPTFGVIPEFKMSKPKGKA